MAITDDEWEGRPIRTRFLRFNDDPQHRRWEQAYRFDNETTWEPNWQWFLERA